MDDGLMLVDDMDDSWMKPFRTGTIMVEREDEP